MTVARKLLRDSEWMRVYQTEEGLHYESKFLTDQLEVSPESVIQRWPKLSARERLEFANAFSAKHGVNPSDERILDFLMEQGDPVVWTAIAPLLPCHRERERILDFLLRRIKEGRESKATYFQALELAADQSVVLALRLAFDKYRRRLREPAGFIEESDSFDYLSCCKSLWTLDGSRQYKEAIEEFSDSPTKAIRAYARCLLGE